MSEKSVNEQIEEVVDILEAAIVIQDDLKHLLVKEAFERLNYVRTELRSQAIHEFAQMED